MALSDRAGLLAGTRVLSFGAFVAGNSAAKLLAELGADVVKIEPFSRPEVLRTPAYAFGESVTEPSGIPNTVMYGTLSRGLRNLSLDLAVPQARPLFHQLVSRSDIVVENFGSSVLSHWGCAFENLIEDRANLVMLSLSGFGRTGPRANYLAYASIICDYIGLTAQWGYAHGLLTDYVAGTAGALAAVAALRLARRSGSPVYLDVAQIEAMAPLLASLYAMPLNTGTEGTSRSNEASGSWLSGVFETRHADQWLALDIENAEDWNVLCRLLERTDLVASEHREVAELRTLLHEEVARWAQRWTAYTAMHQLQRAGLAAGVVQDSEDIWRDPQLWARGSIVRIAQADLGEVTYPTTAQRWAKAPRSQERHPARLGEDTTEILAEWLGVDDEELESLCGSGAIYCASTTSVRKRSDTVPRDGKA